MCNCEYMDAKACIREIDGIAQKRILEILCTSTEISVSGKCYYVSQDGCDENDGRSESTPWKTIEKLNSEWEKGTFLAGDGIFFRRGDRFFGQLMVASGVTVSAYGEGAKPVITGSRENSADPQKWTLLEGTEDIWEYYEELPDVGAIVWNDGEGLFYKEDPDCVEDKFYLPGTDTRFELRCHLRDMRFISYIETNPFRRKGKLYVRCSKGNPGALFERLDISPAISGIIMKGDGVTIDNICVKYVGVHGICGPTLKNITVQNCETGWIGGCIHYYHAGRDCWRLGNGVQIYGGAENFVVDNCYVHDCYDAGVTHQFSGGDMDCNMVDVRYSNNVIQDCAYNIEYGCSDSVDGKANRWGRGFQVSGNILRRAGYGFGSVRSSGCGPSHFVSWNVRNQCDKGTFVIRDNIIDRSIFNSFRIFAGNPDWHPILDKNTYVLLEGTPLGFIFGGDFGADVDVAKTLGDENAKVFVADKNEFCLGELDEVHLKVYHDREKGEYIRGKEKQAFSKL